MSTFEVKIHKLKIEPHPNADALELAVVGDYRVIVRKGQFNTGDLGAYIPEGAVLPDWIIAKLGLEGKLAGKDNNRVKAVRLRGTLSQGLLYPVNKLGKIYDAGVDEIVECYYIVTDPDTGSGLVVEEGDVVTDALGITKYEPPIPVHLAGEVFNAHGMTLKYDIENYRAYPDVLETGEEVVMTEKLHGTWVSFGYHPDAPHHLITSKGLSSKGLAFKLNKANATNTYITALNSTAPLSDGRGGNVIDRAHDIFGFGVPFYIMGEVFGKGIQDLSYGMDSVAFRVFDVYVGAPGTGYYVNATDLPELCKKLKVDMVPVMYTGPFSVDVMNEMTNGKETVSGTSANIREGVVIKPAKERTDDVLGRVILKSVSEDYLLRKGNTTEYQ